MFERQSADLPSESPEAARARAETLAASDAKETSRLIGRSGERFWLVNAQRVSLNYAELRTLAASGRVRSIHGDIGRIAITKRPPRPKARSVHPWGQAQIGTLGAHAQGVTGAGVRVGVIDSGIEPGHPLISGPVVAWGDFVNGHPTPYDDNGHGTMVSGVIAGSRTTPGGTIGVAPGSQLVIAKAIASGGSGDGMAFLRAAEWMADPDGNPATADQPAVVNNSWSTSERNHPWMIEVMKAWRALNILPVFAAGNEGPGEGTIGSPSDYAEVLTVGATASNGGIAGFSSRGPVVWPDPDGPGPLVGGPIIKPDLVAPGDAILTAAPGGGLTLAWGTSLAAPMVAGTAALIKQMDPHATPERMMDLMFRALAPAPGGINAAGRGQLRIPLGVQPSTPVSHDPQRPPHEVAPPPPPPPTPSLALDAPLPRFTNAKRLRVKLVLPQVPILYRFVQNEKSVGEIQHEANATVVFPREGNMSLQARVMDMDEGALGRVDLGEIFVDRTAPVLRPKTTRRGARVIMRVAVVERGSGLRKRATVQFNGKRPRAVGKQVVIARPQAGRTTRVVLRASDRAGNRTVMSARLMATGKLRIITPKRTATKKGPVRAKR